MKRKPTSKVERKSSAAWRKDVAASAVSEKDKAEMHVPINQADNFGFSTCDALRSLVEELKLLLSHRLDLPHLPSSSFRAGN